MIIVANAATEMILTPRCLLWWRSCSWGEQGSFNLTGQLRSIKDGQSRRILPSGLGAAFKIAKGRGRLVRSQTNGEFDLYRNGFAAYVWITTPSGKRTRKYIYGRSREIVHSRWVELTRKAAHGPVVTKVPTVGQFLHQWLEDTVAPNLARSRMRRMRAT
jgi:hypothetical protein